MSLEKLHVDRIAICQTRALEGEYQVRRSNGNVFHEKEKIV
jgi:hypothetical protein